MKLDGSGEWVEWLELVGLGSLRCGGWGCYTDLVDGRKWKIWKVPPYLEGNGMERDPAQIVGHFNSIYNIHYV